MPNRKAFSPRWLIATGHLQPVGGGRAPRQSVFIGTTNETTYLTDPTGNRRYWPARAATIDVEQLRADRDQLFAEAVAAWRSGGTGGRTLNSRNKHIWPEQDRRYEADAWEKPILEWLEKAESNDHSVELIADALSIDRASVRRACIGTGPSRF